MKRGGPLKRTPLKRRSRERQKFMDEDRIPLIKALIEDGFRCEVGMVLLDHRHSDARYCNGRIEGLHELRKRSSGGSLTNRANLVPSCNYCNSWIECNPIEAYEMGLVIREGDSDWDALGKRNDGANESPELS